MRVRPRLVYADPSTLQRKQLIVPGLKDGLLPKKQLIYTDPATIKRPKLIFEKGRKKRIRFIFPAE